MILAGSLHAPITFLSPTGGLLSPGVFRHRWTRIFTDKQPLPNLCFIRVNPWLLQSCRWIWANVVARRLLPLAAWRVFRGLLLFGGLRGRRRGATMRRGCRLRDPRWLRSMRHYLRMLRSVRSGCRLPAAHWLRPMRRYLRMLRSVWSGCRIVGRAVVFRLRCFTGMRRRRLLSLG